MPFTKAQSTAAFAYVVDQVLDFDEDSNIALALQQNGITTMWDLLGMTYDDIDTLMYTDDQGDTIEATKGDRGKLRCLKCYNLHRSNEGDPIIDQDWNGLTAGEFNDYCISMPYTSTQLNKTSAMSTTTTSRPMTSYIRDAMRENARVCPF